MDEFSPFLDNAPVAYTGAGWCSPFKLPARVRDSGAGHYGRHSPPSTQGSTSEVDAALILHERSGELKHKVRLDKSVADQLVHSAAARPRKYRARYLSAQFQGPTARKDAEDSERNRWTTELADLLRGTQSPMGQPGNQLTGGGRRASTLRSRVRGVKRFLSWLALRHELTYPTELSQLTEFLQVRLQEPCNRGSLKGSHHSMVFLESRHKTASLTVSCTTFCARNFWWQLCLAAQQSKRPESSPPCSWHWNTWWSAPRRLVTIGCSPGGSWSRTGPRQGSRITGASFQAV